MGGYETGLGSWNPFDACHSCFINISLKKKEKKNREYESAFL
jgi:hypothetical protein